MVTSKKQKIKKKILDNLNPAELSTDRGKVISTPFRLSRKDKKHSGRYTPRIPEKKKFSEMIANAEEPSEEYNEWVNYRDGFRDQTKITNPDIFWDDEFKEEAIKRNQKIKKQLAIRKAMKDKDMLKGETYIVKND
ncbi:MAG TPA: hypothetical protein VMZ91_15005 [Candidatus Paceibacterota bacterium]|nr:hypothetical protein [Candidatus Paceibacterota bacterium]